MPIIRSVRTLKPVGRGLVALALVALILGPMACTRDDVAAAVATVAVQLEATLQPWGATVAARTETLETSLPAALATAKAPAALSAAPSVAEVSANRDVRAATTNIPTPVVVTPAASTPAASTPAASTPAASTPTPPPTASPLPTATATPTITATPSPTPYPDVIDVPNGSMRLIAGGTFQMGASADALAEECATFREGCLTEWFAASEPSHNVLLDSFYVDEHEVTNAAYAAFLNATGDLTCFDQPCLDSEQSQIAAEDSMYTVPEGLELHPAAGITWYGAAAYCAERGARLPTEAEWERAAAWDSETAAARRYPWGDTFDGQRVNSCDAACDAPQAHADFNDGFPEVAPIGSYAAGVSPAGIHDMAGNVWEWVADWYDPGYYAQSPPQNPSGPAEGREKVVRGGSWFDTGNFTAAAIRFPSAPDNADKTIGFRCAADLP